MVQARSIHWEQLVPALISILLVACSDTSLNDPELVYNKDLGSLAHAETIPLQLVASEAYLILVQQNGMDVRLEVSAPSGELMASSDVQALIRGPESIVLVTPVSGEYVVTVKPIMPATSGNVVLVVKKLLQASEADQRRLRAEQAVASAAAATQTWDPAYWAPKVADVEAARKSFCTMKLQRRCAWVTTFEAWLRYKYLEQWSRSRTLAHDALSLISPDDQPAEYAAVIALYAMTLIEGDEHEPASEVARRRNIADAYFTEATRIQRRLGAIADGAWSRNAHAMLFYYQGRQQDAESAFIDSIRMAQSVGATAFVQLFRKNLAVISRNSDFTQNIETLENVAAAIDPAQDPGFFGITQFQLGERYLEHGRWRDAVGALAIAYEHMSSPGDRVLAQIELARAYLEAGRFDRAGVYVAEARAVAEQINQAPMRLRLRQIAAELAIVENRANDEIASLEDALQEARAKRNQRDIGLLATTLTRLQLAAGRTADAIRTTEISVAASEAGKDLPELVHSLLTAAKARLAELTKENLAIADEYLSRIDEFEVSQDMPVANAQKHSLVAQVRWTQGDRNGALNASARAVELLWNQRFAVDNPEYRSGQLRSASEIYLRHADLLYRFESASPNPDFAKLFLFVDALKGLMLQRQIIARRERAVRGNSHDETRISELTRAAATAATGGAKVSADTRTIRSQLEAAHRERDLQVHSHIEAPPIDQYGVAEIQSMVPRGTTVLQYWLKGPRALVWIISRDSIRTLNLGEPQPIRSTARQLYVALASSQPEAVVLKEQLVQMILPPGVLRDANTELLVVPDAELNAIPFTLMVDPAISVKHLYAVSLLTMAHAPYAKPESITLFGNPAYKPQSGLPPLPGTGREVEQIASQIAWRDADVWIGKYATRRQFLADAGKRDVLHVAAHGVFDLDNPQLSGIAVSDLEEDDGFLTLADLWALDLSGTQLVVLSGCKTAFGAASSLEGLSGFPASVLAAGASHVLVSLWDIPDGATSRLMERFYEEIVTYERPPSAALRAAQDEVRQMRRWRHPYYWGGWVLIGTS
jgi:CHAT domain-containing protein/tetratricopeptide (TPR) repeat protein